MRHEATAVLFGPETARNTRFTAAKKWFRQWSATVRPAMSGMLLSAAACGSDLAAFSAREQARQTCVEAGLPGQDFQTVWVFAEAARRAGVSERDELLNVQLRCQAGCAWDRTGRCFFDCAACGTAVVRAIWR